MKSSEALRWFFCAAGMIVVSAAALLLEWPFPAAAFGVITVGAVTLWISEALPGNLVAFLLPAAYVLFGVGKPAQVLSPWTTSMCWLVLGGIVISRMMDKCGVSRRLALWALNTGGGSLRNLFWGIMLAGFLIAPFVPTVMGKAALFVVILGGMCRALNLKPGGPEASCLFLCGLLALAEPKFLFFTSSVDSTLLMGTASELGMRISWLEYAWANAVPGVLYAVCCVLLLRFVAPREARDFRAFVEKEYRALGPTTKTEKKAFVLLALVALAMVTDSWHGVDIGWLMMVAAGLCFMPGMRLLDADDLRKLPLDMVFFVAGCMTIGAAAHAAGIDAVIGRLVNACLADAGRISSLLGAFAAGTGMSMSFTTLPAVSTLGPALTEAGLHFGSSGQALLYAFLYGLDQFLMPYVFAPALYFYASGYISIGRYVSFQMLKLGMTVVFLLAVAIPWWSCVL